MPIRILKTCTDAVHGATLRHLEWIHRVTTERPHRVLLGVVLLLALSVASILHIRFEADVFKLFPTKGGALRLFLDSLDWTGSAKEAYFLLEGDREKLVPAAEVFAGRLHGLRVDGEPAFSRITYRVYDEAEAGAFADFVGYAAVHPQLFLSPADVPRYLAALSPRTMDRSLQRATTELASQASMGMGQVIAADPFYLRELLLPRLKEGSQALDLDPASPYFLSRDGRVLIMIAAPARPVQDMAFARKLVAGINQARAGATVQISCTGAHLNAVIDEASMKRNIIVGVVTSMLLVLALFYLTYRRILPTLLLPVIVLCGVVLALGIAGCFLSSVHIISFAFTALIIGLGTDYTIHLYDRFYTERSTGRPFEEALRLAMLHTGHGIFTAAITTGLPFLALVLSDVRALSELGLLVGLGVVFSMYATFFFLPPLLVLVERRLPASAYRPLPGFGLAGAWRLGRRCGRPVRVVSLLLIVGMAVAACFTFFEGDLKKLQPRQSEALLTQEKIEQHLSLSPKQMLVAVEGSRLDDVLARGARVNALLERYRQEGKLASFSSLDRLINDRAIQAELSGALARGMAASDPAGEARRALERNGFAIEPFQPLFMGLAALRGDGTVPPAEAFARLAASPLRGVVDRHLVQRDGRYHLLYHLFYRGAEFPRDAFLHELAAIDPAARATGVELVSRQLSDSVKVTFAQGALLGGVLVLFMLGAHFRTPAGLFYSLYPMVVGVVGMLGIMALTGMGINFMNAMVLVTLTGMGSDYGLYVGYRVTDAPPDRREAEFVQTGRALFLSALTNIVGFGSLAFADYGALASIGWATNYGVGITALFALLSLPAFIRVSERTDNSVVHGERALTENLNGPRIRSD